MLDLIERWHETAKKAPGVAFISGFIFGYCVKQLTELSDIIILWIRKKVVKDDTK